jgi:hypothetical protein
MGNGGIVPPFLTSALDEGEWSASRPYRFTSGETAPSTHYIGSLVGLGAGLHVMEKREISFPYRESNLDFVI